MSPTFAGPRQATAAGLPVGPGAPAAVEFHYTQTESFVALLHQLLSGLRFPEVIGFQKDAVQHTFVIPPVNQPFGI